MFSTLCAQLQSQVSRKVLGLQDVADTACSAGNQVIRRNGCSIHWLAHVYTDQSMNWAEAGNSAIRDSSVSEAAEARKALRRAAKSSVKRQRCADAVKEVVQKKFHALDPLAIGGRVGCLVRNPQVNKEHPFWDFGCQGSRHRRQWHQGVFHEVSQQQYLGNAPQTSAPQTDASSSGG